MRFLSNLTVNDSYTLPSVDGTSGQAIITDGAGNLSFSDVSVDTGATVIYQDNFTGDDLTNTFTLAHAVNDEVITQVYIDGVYQNKSTYSTLGDQLIFSQAPFLGSSIEVISMNSVSYGGFQFDVTGAVDNDLLVYDAVSGLWQSTKVINTIQFEGGTGTQGTMSWNAADETVDLIVSPDVTYQLGQELGLVVRNLSGQTINNGTVVKVTGASGNKVTIDLASNTGEYDSSSTFAVVTETINNNSTGRVTTEGLVRGLDTSAFTEGVALWLGANGQFTATKPLSPNHLVHIGWVVRSHATEGAIFVKVSNGWEIEELHDVLITNAADKDLLAWNALLGVWENTKTVGDITTGNINVTGLLYVPDNIIHTGDNGTNIQFDSGQLRINTSGIPRISITDASVQVTNPFIASSTITALGGNSTQWNSAYSFTSTYDITDYTDPKYLRSDESDSMTGNLSVSGSVAVGDNADLASSANVGALRYRSDLNNSYVDMCMQTGVGTYAWVNIVQNNW